MDAVTSAKQESAPQAAQTWIERLPSQITI